MTKAVSTTEQRERFEALVARAEDLIASSPTRYRVRLGLLAGLGYVVIFGVLGALVTITAGTLWAAIASTALFLLLLKKKIIIVLAIMAWVLAKALWVRFDAPQGYRLTREAAPELFRVLDEQRKLLHSGRIHAVLLSNEFNASVVQTPRLGVLGWHQNWLILGVPLLLALRPEEAQAVVAHELGHLSRNHSRFNGWIYRVRISWFRVMQAFDQTEGFAVGVLRRFFDWYAPYFDAMSFALARANEYEADAVAAELTSRTALAGALVGTTVRDDVAGEHYWGPLLGRAESEPEPERHPFGGLREFHAAFEAPTRSVDASLHAAMARETNYADTHPSLRDRLAAVGAEPQPVFTVDNSAGEAWLGSTLDTVLEAFDEDWLKSNGEAWSARFEETRESRDRLTELAARAPETLAPLELWELASLTEAHHSSAEALPLFRDYQSREPDDVDVEFVLGRILLDQDDEASVAHMERAEERFALALRACEYLHAYYKRAGDEPGAERWRLRGERQIDLESRAHAERENLSPKDVFLPSELDEEALAHLRTQLAARDNVRHAWIALKRVAIVPELPVYVLAWKPKGWLVKAAKVSQAIADEVELQGECYVVPRSGETKAVAKRVIERGEQLL